MREKNKITVGLALGSGGAKGLAHIGVIKELERNKIKIDYIAGTSIGALIGAHYALYGDIGRTEALAQKANWRTGIQLFDPSLKGGFIAGKRIEELFDKWFEKKTFACLKIPFAAVATDLVTGREVDLKTGSLTKAVRASISVPAVFQPIEYNGQFLADGGLCNPLPDDTVRHMGADIVIAVNLDTRYFENGFDKSKLTLPSATMRALNIMRYYLAKNTIRTADIVLEPKMAGGVGLIGWNPFFDQKKSREIINSGVEVVNKFLFQIKELVG